MRKRDTFYPFNYESFRVVSAAAYVFEFLVDDKAPPGEDSQTMILPKSQVELDEDTQVVYISSWILKKKLENKDTGYGVLPDKLVDWLADNVDWKEGDGPDE